MKFKLKKLIALGLTLAMTCSALSMPAYALNVVDNPEVSTDGTNSVDSSTFETVEITTDENGNTVIGTDETESETTTPTEGGEETTPPTTEGGEETTIPPTTEGGETTTPPTTEGGETTTPPTTEGGETTTPPTTEGGEETTPPTTEGGETTTPPEVVDPGFGVDPVDPGFNVDPEFGVPPVDPNPELPGLGDETTTDEFVPLPEMSLMSLMTFLENAPMETIKVDYVGYNKEIITEKEVEIGYIDDVAEKNFEFEGKHYEFINATVNDVEILYVAEYTDENNVTYTYYSTDGRTAVLIENTDVLHFNYREYYNVTLNKTGNGTASCDNKVYADLVTTVLSVAPDKAQKVNKITVNGIEQSDVSLNASDYNIPITSDTTINVEFAERTEDYNINIVNSDFISIDKQYTVPVGGNEWKTNPVQFSIKGSTIDSIIVNGQNIDISFDRTGILGSSITKRYNIPGTYDGTQFVITYRDDSIVTTTSDTNYYYKISIPEVYNDMEIQFGSGASTLVVSNLVNTSTSQDGTIYFANPETGNSLQIFEPGKKITVYDVSSGNKLYFYYKPDIGYNSGDVTLDSTNIFGSTIFRLEGPNNISGLPEQTSGLAEAKELGLTNYFCLVRTSAWQVWSDSRISLDCKPIEYKAVYNINGVSDPNTYTIEEGKNRITLPITEISNDNGILAGWTGPDGKYYGAGSIFIIDENTVEFASGNNQFVFEPVYIPKNRLYSVEHYWENESGEYDLHYTDKNIPLPESTSGTTQTAIAIPMDYSDEGYYFDPLNTNNVRMAVVKEDGTTTLKLYYKAFRRVQYDYDVNGVDTYATLKTKYYDGNEITLRTAPNSTDASGSPLYFAGWAVNGDTENLLKAGDVYKLSSKVTKFSAVYYSATELGYNKGDIVGGSSGKVNTTLFDTPITVELSDDGTNACVYGTTNITKEELVNYSAIGFVISSYNNAPTTVGGFNYTSDTNVYGKIKVNGVYNEDSAEGYYYGVNLKRCTTSTVKDFTVTPYVTLLDGTIIYGTPSNVSFN